LRQAAYRWRVSRYDWVLFLHVLSAFAFVAAYTILTVVLVAARRIETARAALDLLSVARSADVLAWAGATGTLVFGIWLAVDVEGYELWDGWILGAFLFWLVAEEAIRRLDLTLKRARHLARAPALPRAADPTAELRAVLRSRHTLALHIVGSGALPALLALMIFKPGAA
jgi:uncharacterized membrane protein